MVGALATINVHAVFFIGSVQSVGWVEASLGLFGFSAILWFALYAIVTTGHDIDSAMPPRPLGRGDAVILSVALILIVLPWHFLALPAMLLVAGWSITTAPVGAPERRAGVILLTLGGSIVVARVLLNGFGDSIVAFDAQFVGWLAGVPVNHNMVDFAVAGERSFIIGPPCSSVHNMSLAAVLWASVVQLLRIRTDVRLFGFCVLAMIGMFLVNAIRLVAIAWYPDHFDSIHSGTIGSWFGIASLIVAGTVVLCGVIDAHRRHG